MALSILTVGNLETVDGFIILRFFSGALTHDEFSLPHPPPSPLHEFARDVCSQRRSQEFC